ncbi:MAG TPA: tetratricopeptide repeat protein, partial [Phycisphaerae bacterium]|nr:tetratricopeptide repeat protein [Phycisphaerae bacterium]
LSELGRIPEAISAMEKALALRPDDPSVCNNLGYFYADRGVELAKAERLIRKALAARATEAAFLDSLGWVFYKQGRFREAVSVFETVLTQMDDQKDSPVIYDHAGDAYWRDGQKDRAISAWKKAVELAEKDKSKSSEVETLRKLVPAKLQAAASGKAPTPAPLGEGVKDNPSPR